ncbi:MAG: DUF481 domain-containing protein [Gemmatimonadota bacterium]|nr:DUF481 domain-containing protein [Gemmatimonadota bacterium]
MSTISRTGFAARLLALVGAAVTLLPAAATAQEEDERELGWFYNAELSAVWTGGNASARTLGFGAAIRGVWERSELNVRGTGLTAHTGRVTRVAVGTIDDFEVDKDTDTEKTAENWSLRGRYEQDISDYFFWFAGAGWERNTFAGFSSRVSAVGGAGNTWLEDDFTLFKTTYGVTYTVQDDVIEDPATPDSFLGFRIGGQFTQQITETTDFESLAVLDDNFAELEDLRLDWTNSLIIDISDALAFKTSLQLLFDNLPSLTQVPLEQPLGTPTGEFVLAPLSKLDTQFTIALVASF